MWPFSRKQSDEEAVAQTLSDMVALSLSHPTTRPDWIKVNRHTLSNGKLGLVVEEDLWSNNGNVKQYGGEAIKIGADGSKKLFHAMVAWREWDDAQKRISALEQLTSKLEHICASLPNAEGGAR